MSSVIFIEQLLRPADAAEVGAFEDIGQQRIVVRSRDQATSEIVRSSRTAVDRVDSPQLPRDALSQRQTTFSVDFASRRRPRGLKSLAPLPGHSDSVPQLQPYVARTSEIMQASDPLTFLLECTECQRSTR